MKTAAKILAGALVLAVVAWTATYLYWHIKILGAIRTLETQTAPVVGAPINHNSEAAMTLDRAGCRSLPYLIGALGSPKTPDLIWSMLSQAFYKALPGDVPPEPELKLGLDVIYENAPKPGDTAQARAEKTARIQAWWRESGHRIHQAWRVWSPSCCSP